MSEIVLRATAEFKDLELREWFSIMQRQIESLKDRSKKQTREIQELRKEVKK